MTAPLPAPVHVRHNPDGDGPVCSEIVDPASLRPEPATEAAVQRWARDGLDVHPAHDCPHTSRRGDRGDVKSSGHFVRLSPDDYAALLAARRDAYNETHPPQVGFPALLDWFIQDGDDEIVDMAAINAANRAVEDERPKRPRTYRPASHWRDQLERIDARLEALTGVRAHDTDDLAAYGGIGIRRTARQHRRHAARIDTTAAEYVRLTDKRRDVAAKLSRAQARETTT